MCDEQVLSFSSVAWLTGNVVNFWSLEIAQELTSTS